MTAGFRAPLVGAVAVVGGFPYLQPSSVSVGVLTVSVTSDGERVTAVGGGHGTEAG